MCPNNPETCMERCLECVNESVPDSPEAAGLECVTDIDCNLERLTELAGPCEWNIDHWLTVAVHAMREVRRGIEIAQEAFDA